MEPTNKKEISLKSVRLQGFKGFKLKNTQILFKPNLSKKTLLGRTPEKKTVKPSTNLKSPEKNSFGKLSATNSNKDEVFANITIISNSSSEIIAQKSNKETIMSPEDVNVKSKTESMDGMFDSKQKSTTIHSYQSTSSFQGKTSPHSKSFMASIHPSISSLDHNLTKTYESPSNHSTSQKKHSSTYSPSSSSRHDSHNHSNDKYSSNNKHHSRSRHRSRSREKRCSFSKNKDRSSSGETSSTPHDQHRLLKPSPDNKKSQRSSSSRLKRKRTSTSSLSSSQSSDDDEVMRKMREKRKASQRSSETYTPRKKVRETEDFEAVSKMILDFDKKETPEKDTKTFGTTDKEDEVEAGEPPSVLAETNAEKPLKIISNDDLQEEEMTGNEVLRSNMQDVERKDGNNRVSVKNFSTTSIQSSHKDELEDMKLEDLNEKNTSLDGDVKETTQSDDKQVNDADLEAGDDFLSPPSQSPTPLLNSNDDNKHIPGLQEERPSFLKDSSYLNNNDSTTEHINVTNSEASNSNYIKQSDSLCNNLPVSKTLCTSLPDVMVTEKYSHSLNTTSTLTTVTSSAAKDVNFCPSASSESTKLVLPAKKRYHEWIRSISQQENDVKSPTSKTFEVIQSSHTEESHYDASSVPVDKAKTKSEAPFSDNVNPPNLPQTTQDLSTFDQKLCEKSSFDQSFFGSEKTATVSSEDIHRKVLENEKVFDSIVTPTGSHIPSTHHPHNDYNCSDALTINSASSHAVKMESTSSFQLSSSNADIAVENNETLLKETYNAADSSSTSLSLYQEQGEASPSLIMFGDDDSPVINYSISDDESSLSGIDAMSPIDIRIPIDNTVSSCADESKQEENEQMVVDEVTNDKTEQISEIASNSASGVQLTSNDESSEEGIRRSVRIKTQVKKKKKPVLPPPPSEVDDKLINSHNTQVFNYLDKENLEVSRQIPVERQSSFEIKSSEGITPSPFEMIKENIYLFQKKKSRARKEIRRMLCECINNNDEGKPPCGDNCLNRLLMIECSARCPYGELCTNKRFQRGEYMMTEVFETSWKGLGLRAAESIPPNKLVMEYCGEVLDPYEFYRRSQLYAETSQQHFYFMALSQEEIIDATYKGNNSRFINHSCDPNCETQKWTVNGRLRVGFFSVREVQEGEEITFDYQFERYGKEAQKCFCGSLNCRGYLGKPPSDNDAAPVVSGSFLNLDMQSSVIAEKERKQRIKMERIQEYKDNTLENEISRLNNGLQTTKEVLLLSRLMVRSDSIKERIMCLHVIRKSDNQGSLRAFLHFHGLPLIWSWMVDVSGGMAAPSNLSTDVMMLKTEILKTLAILPINNRNILEDSKVLSMVKRWSEENSELKVKDSGVKNNEVNDNKLDDDKLDDDKLDDDRLNDDKLDGVEGNLLDQDKSNKLASDKTEKVENDVQSKIEVLQDEVLFLSSSLLNAWKDLKEIYRIPKRQKSTSDVGSSLNSGEMAGDGKSQTSPTTSSSNMKVRDEVRNRSSLRDKDGRIRDHDRDKRSRRSPVKIRLKDEEISRSSKPDSGNKFAWLDAPVCSRLSREEHRRQFERDVKNRDEKKQEFKQDPLNIKLQSSPLTPMTSSSTLLSTSLNLSNTSTGTTSTHDATTFTPSVYSGNLIQINPSPIPPTSVFYPNSQLNYVGNPVAAQIPPPPYLTASAQNQQLGVLGAPPAPQLIPPSQAASLGSPYSSLHQFISSTLPSSHYTTVSNNASGVSVLGYYGNNAVVLLTPEQLKELTNLLTFKSLQQASVQQSVVAQQTLPLPPTMQPVQQQIPTVQQPLQPVQQPIQPIQQPIQPIQQPVQPIQQPIQPIQKPIQPVQPPVSQSPGISSKPPEILAASQLTPVSSNVRSENPLEVSASETPSETSSNPSTIKTGPKDPRPPRLPLNWKTASDADGCVYYYHVITRQTQWDPPTWDASIEDMVGKKESDMEMSSPKPEVVSKKESDKLAATAVIASDTDQAKKAKESFRSRMSQHIVNCLSSYRKSDCKVGRITSNEDFKRLARKLTYNVLMKEIKQVQVWEDLECNANVKHKAKEYVRKYMAKMGPVYKSKDDESR